LIVEEVMAVTANVRPGRLRSRDAAQHEQKRAEICRVAAAVFAERGFEGGTTTEIARRAGLSQPALYHYVGSKEMLLDAICMELGAKFRERLTAIQAQNGSAVDRLTAFIEGHVSVMVSELDSFRVYVNEARYLAPRRRKRIQLEEKEYVREVVSLVEDAQRAGAIAENLDPWLTTQLIFGMLGWMVRWYRPGGRLTGHDVARTVTAMLLRSQT
jgi:AcrR family transcriptional regulator